MVSKWRRVSKSRPCPVCGRPDWCGYVGPDDNPEAVICARVESPKRCGEAGWLHRLRESSLRRPIQRRVVPTKARAASPAAGVDLAGEVAAAVQWSADHPAHFEQFARSLGLSIESLQRLHVGYSKSRRAWLFPMRDAAGEIVGVRLRLRGGKKLSIKGGGEGLFLPENIAPGERLLICEGPTDCAALLDLGFSAVGRPSCRGGARHLIDLVRRLEPYQVVVVADHDAPGQAGAADLAMKLAAYCGDVRSIEPPEGIKDARAWKAAGATTTDVQQRIDAAEPWRLRIETRKKEGKTTCPKKATA